MENIDVLKSVKAISSDWCYITKSMPLALPLRRVKTQFLFLCLWRMRRSIFIQFLLHVLNLSFKWHIESIFQVIILNSIGLSILFTPPQNRGGVIFSLQFVSVCVCVCVCVCLYVCLSVCVSGFLVNKIPAERVHRFGRGFRYMVAYRTGSDPIEFGDLGSKVKVTVT